jgi:hypothetical protein
MDFDYEILNSCFSRSKEEIEAEKQQKLKKVTVQQVEVKDVKCLVEPDRMHIITILLSGFPLN